MAVPTRKTTAFVAGVALLAGLLTVVSRSTRPPQLPRDAEHRWLSANDACAPCHGEGARWPVSPGHPPKDDCLLCHGAPS